MKKLTTVLLLSGMTLCCAFIGCGADDEVLEQTAGSPGTTSSSSSSSSSSTGSGGTGTGTTSGSTGSGGTSSGTSNADGGGCSLGLTQRSPVAPTVIVLGLLGLAALRRRQN